jgi:hypothetical protein
VASVTCACSPLRGDQAKEVGSFRTQTHKHSYNFYLVRRPFECTACVYKEAVVRQQ